MAFLDNSGDIILDAVLTDTGRYRLAKGNGSFKIAKFALGDDEIDYSLYDKTNTNGSAYYDLNILQTPILEAFTNNASSLKSKLLTITRTDLLYLPVMKLNTSATGRQINSTFQAHMVSISGNWSDSVQYIDGINNNKNMIRVDQGIDSISAGNLTNIQQIIQELNENQYIVELDYRLGTIISANNGITPANYSFIDDDNIATYYFSVNVRNGGAEYVAPMKPKPLSSQDPDEDSTTVILGARGTKLQFSIKSSDQLITSDYLFNTLGSTALYDSKNIKYIDTTVRVTGATTGYRVDIPIRFVKAV